MRLKVVFFIIFLCSNLFAQQISVKFFPAKKKIFLGEKVKFEITITSNIPIKNISDNISVKLKDFNVTNITREISPYNCKLNFFLQFFNTGKIILPEIGFKVKTSDGEFFVYTDRLKLNILSNLKPDTKFQPLKSPVKVNFYLTRQEWIFIGCFILFIILLIFIILKILKIKKTKKVSIREITPFEEIENNLKICEKYLSNKQLRKFYFTISSAMRNYIDRKFNIITLKSTYREIEKILGQIELEKSLIDEVLTMYRKWDYIKFTGNFSSIDDAYRDFYKVKQILKKIEELNYKNASNS